MTTTLQLAKVGGRAHLSLNGRWHVLVDAYDRGEIQRFWENRTQAHPGELIEYGFADADTLEVPGDWNTQRAELFFYEGVVWYQRDFDYAPVAGKRQVLHFGAANYRARVWVNGNAVGEHIGGYTPFALEVTGRLRPGRNSVVVRVDNRHGDADIPVRLTDWLHYGGLTRDVRLLDLPATFIENYHAQLAPGRRDRIRGWVRLNGAQGQQQVTVCVPEIAAAVTVASDGDGRAEFAFDAAPELWSPERPRLYRVEVHAESDAVDDAIGFRTIATRGRDILLNGEPIFLRGISLHEESLLHRGRVHSAADAAALLGLAKELGCNFVRLAHYPHNEHMMRAADQLGLLVWAEIPLYWGIDWSNAATLELAKQQLTELIERDRNCAAVVLWSMSNETHPTPDRNAFLGALVDHTRWLDPTRLITNALFGGLGELFQALSSYITARSEGRDPEPITLRIVDPLAAQLDVLGWNEYVGWYYPVYLAMQLPLAESEIRAVELEAMAEFRIATEVDKPLIVSEFGADAKHGRHGDRNEVFTEEYQAYLYRQQLRMLAHAPNLRGMSPWILKDFLAPMRVRPGIQDYYNRKGLVSEAGEKKLAFAVLQEFYARVRAASSPE